MIDEKHIIEGRLTNCELDLMLIKVNRSLEELEDDESWDKFFRTRDGYCGL